MGDKNKIDNTGESLEVVVARIDQRTEDLIKQFDKISNGTGFPRCESRLQRIVGVEKGLQRVEDNFKWLRNTFIGLVMTTVLIIMLTMGFNFIEESLTHDNTSVIYNSPQEGRYFPDGKSGLIGQSHQPGAGDNQ